MFDISSRGVRVHPLPYQPNDQLPPIIRVLAGSAAEATACKYQALTNMFAILAAERHRRVDSKFCPSGWPPSECEPSSAAIVTRAAATQAKAKDCQSIP